MRRSVWLVLFWTVGGTSGCLADKVRMEGAEVRVIDASGAPVAGVELRVEAADEPDPGGEAFGWTRVTEVSTDAQGVARLERDTAYRFHIPIPHASGARGHVTRAFVGKGARALPITGALAIQARLDAAGGVDELLTFVSGCTLWQADDAPSAACCEKVRRLGGAQAFLAGASGPGHARAVGAAVIAAAQGLGFTADPLPQVDADLARRIGDRWLQLSGPMPADPGQPACAALALLRDGSGRALEGFLDPVLVPTPATPADSPTVR